MGNERVLIAFIALLICFPISAQSTFEVDGIVYSEDLSQKDKMVVYVVRKARNDPASNPYGSYYEGNIKIPPMIEHDLDHYLVSGIAQSAFNFCSKVDSIEINCNVRTVGTNTIIGCPNLKYIKFPDNLESIELSGVDLLPELEGVELGNGLKYIDDSNFRSTQLTELKIPDSVISIKGVSFSGNKKLIKVCFGKGIEEIGEGAFALSPLKEVIFTQEVPLIPRPFFLHPAFRKELHAEFIIKVPKNCKKNYEKVWGDDLNIVEE